MADNTPQSEEFKQELKSFLRDFGVRGFTREPYYPRWHEAPEYVFDILKSLIQDQIPVKKEQKIARKLQTSRIEHRIKKRPLGLVRMATTLSNSWVRKKIHSIPREPAIQPGPMDHHEPQNLLGYRKEPAKTRILGGPFGHIFSPKKRNTNPDLQKMQSMKTKPESARQFQAGKPNFLSMRHVTPAKFLQGFKEFNDQERNTGFILHGLPASQGRLTGTVRVLNRIEEIGDVHAGEILVVPRTDPGWTPVFSKIGGLITETGGILSHGAVVSREYGIPAVTNIQNACQLLHNGQTVTIDGSKGIISI